MSKSTVINTVLRSFAGYRLEREEQSETASELREGGERAGAGEWRWGGGGAGRDTGATDRPHDRAVAIWRGGRRDQGLGREGYLDHGGGGIYQLHAQRGGHGAFRRLGWVRGAGVFLGSNTNVVFGSAGLLKTLRKTLGYLKS